MSANTDTLVERREANTTDADTAAFIDNTDESLIIIIIIIDTPNKTSNIYRNVPFMNFVF